MIKVRDLWKSYGKIKVLKGLNLDVFTGETLVILGRSGVGKSVLLKQIIGTEQPDKGSIVIDDVDITRLSGKDKLQAHQSMGMLFQGAALFDSMNVKENVAFYLREHERWLSEKEINERVKHSLEMVDLLDVESKMPSDLSGGMRKRAALARLIIYRPRLLLYDEPTTGLDPITANQINGLILKTQHELKATSIVVTHDLYSALTVADRLALHDDGQIKVIADKKDFFQIENPLIQAFYSNTMLPQEMKKEQELI